MIFTYKHWDDFCKKLADKGVRSVPIKDIVASSLCRIETRCGNKCTKGFSFGYDRTKVRS